MHRLHTTYNALDNPPNILFLLLGCVVFVLVVYFCITTYYGVGRDTVMTLNTGTKVNPFLAALLPVTFLFIGFSFQEIEKLNIYRHHKIIMNSTQLKTIAGYVDDYAPGDQDGHGEESFTVQGVEFRYSYLTEETSYYHATYWYGGVIRPNLYVRIGYYYDGKCNAILKLETE